MIDTKFYWLVWIAGTLYTTARANNIASDKMKIKDPIGFLLLALIVFSWSWPITIWMGKEAWQAEV